MKQKRHVAGHEFAADLPARVCAKCGTSYFDDLVVSQFDALVAARLAEAGVMEAAALKFMRKVTGLQGKEFAELLAVRPETVSRWEQGKRPIDRATYAIIRQLVYERARGVTATADYLRSLRRPKRLPKMVRIALPRAA
jgi:putative zinc finger/helix-turn-helix YgiT family protein